MRQLLVILILFPLLQLQAEDDFPFKLDPLRDGLFLFSGIALEGTYAALYFTSETPSRESMAGLRRSDVNAFDRAAIDRWSPDASSASDVVLYGLTALPSLLFFDGRVRSHLATFIILYIESYMLADGLKNTIKELVKRKRPFNYGIEAPESARLQRDAERSFYSGHTSQAFNAAVFFSYIFSELYPDSPWRWVIWGTSLAAASTVGFLRFWSGKHFPTDILAGAAIGGVTGWLVPFLAKKRDIPVTILPVTAEGIGLSVTLRF